MNAGGSRPPAHHCGPEGGTHAASLQRPILRSGGFRIAQEDHCGREAENPGGVGAEPPPWRAVVVALATEMWSLPM